MKGSTPEPVDAITPRTPPAGAEPPEAVTPSTPPAAEEAWPFELFTAAELPLAVEAEAVWLVAVEVVAFDVEAVTVVAAVTVVPLVFVVPPVFVAPLVDVHDSLE